MPEDFLLMLRETWENNVFKISNRAQILNKLKITEFEMANLAYTIRSLIDGTFTCN